MPEISNQYSLNKVQETLKKLGFDPGPIDGIYGRKTRAALLAFQSHVGLPKTGRADSATLTKLFRMEPVMIQPVKDKLELALPWMTEAEHLMGVKEVQGPKHNSVILNWARRLFIPYDKDEIPWCGLFVAHCIGATLPDEILPRNPLGARNWRRFGQSVDPENPPYGSILVFHRGDPNGWQGHVGFNAGRKGRDFVVLGGNQRNEVNKMIISRKRLLEARWPMTVPVKDGRVITDGVYEMSENEA